MAAFLVSKRDGANMMVALSDGGAVEIFPGVGSGASGAAILIFPTVAAMQAYNASTPQVLVKGQPAIVQSNMSLWALSVGFEGLTVDHITVASVTAPPFANAVWERVNASLSLPGFLQQGTWIVDPANSTGLASDENDGLTLTTPILTNAEIFRRWGYTWSPELSVPTGVHYLSSQASNNDPGPFNPILVTSTATLTLFASLPATPSFTGTLNVVTAKNRATNTPLQATFTTSTGTISSGQLLVNATRGGSLAWTVSGGPTFVLSQPLSAYIGGDPTARSEIDTWAHGDAISGYANLVAICIPSLGATVNTLPATSAPSVIVNDLALVDFTAAASPLTVNADSNVAFLDVLVGRSLDVQAAASTFATFSNCAFGDLVTTQGVGVNLEFSAGFCGGSGFVAFSGLFTNDIVLEGPFVGSQVTLTNLFIATGQSIEPGGDSLLLGTLYGAGQCNLLVNGTLSYTGSPTSAFPLSGGIKINALTSAYSYATTAGSTAVHLVSLSPSNLNAAAGAAGFGNLATIPGVGTYTNGSVTP